MEQSILIRPIRREDGEALAGLIRATLKAHGLDIPGTAYWDPSLGDLPLAYRAENSGYLVMERGGSPGGGGGYAPIGLFPECCELQKLYLAPELQGRGLGRRLLEAVEHSARAAGYRRIYLETHSRLGRAVRLYRAAGYRQILRPEGVVHSAMDLFFLKEL